MEDDDSDTSMTIDESVSAEKTPASGTVCSEIASEHVSSPKQVETDNDVTKSESDIKKSLNSQDNGLPPNSRSSEKNVDSVISDSDVPKSPKKVNGEVQSLKCENRQQSDTDISANSAGTERVRLSEDEDEDDDRDTNSESENVKNSSKCEHVSVLSGEIKEDGQNAENNAEYKGFKKKIIAQTSIASNNTSDNVPITESASVGSSKSVKSKKPSPKNTLSSESQPVLISHQPLPDGTQSSAQLTEYAQYLGLQPTVKFKCYKCGESGFPSMLRLQEHQNICLKNVTSTKMQSILKPPPSPAPSELSPSTNFRITRKVYLCSACGTYYENWNLFLHMREVHKRHICLFCLGMFSQADKLATHLSGRHGLVETAYTSVDHFIGENKGSFFLMCCTCERMFSERENFYDHSCSEGLVINAEKACSLCGLRGAHFPTCRKAFTDSNNSPPSSSTIPTPVENPAEPVQNSQHGIQERSALVTKYLIPVGKPPGKKVNKGIGVQENLSDSQDKSRDLSDIDDDYDISNAASFCHVNIHEPQQKIKALRATRLRTYKGKNQDGVSKKPIAESKPAESLPTSTKENESKEKCVETSEHEEADRNTVESPETAPEKASQENDKVPVVEEEKSDTTMETKNDESTCDPEPEKMDVDVDMDVKDNDKTDEEKCPSPEAPAKEEKEVPSESDAQPEMEEQAPPEPSPPAETDEKLSPKPEISPKSSPQEEAKLASKTQSATEAESESESSDSGDESDSSSSSEASSEESDRHEEVKTEEKMEESDADNADSDKMSLVVDENRSEEETEPQPEKPNQEDDDEEKEEAELQINEDETVKQDDPKSDAEVMDNVVDDNEENKSVDEEKAEEPGESIQLAGDDVPLLELTLEENLDTMNIQLLLKESVKVSCLNCVYCNHAKKIAVNGKQLALHLLAEHRFAPVVCSDSGELTEADGFVDKLKSSLLELQQMFFNTDSYDSMDQNCMRPYDRTYECFHCHFLTTLHKELYVHNRKMHQKTILLCIMCKSNFYSYSELLCHLCPGIYVPESNISFRCCLCTVDGLPSAFRLMVHLRKRHHACDVCLETTGDQQKLSNHVWKHKLHHLCYRCGIAYRNKPDITKHLFWKHGTESVLCKKCLQKKWPHVYHFCIPPNAFVCEECNSSFSRAVALKVHKRLHAGDLPYPCDECEERFISRKLLVKHQEKHREPTLEVVADANMEENGPMRETSGHEGEEDEDKPKTENESHQEMDKVSPEFAANNSSLEKEEEEERVKDSAPTPPASETKDETALQTSVAESSGEGSKLEEKDSGEKKSKVLDVYDLPPLNLSSESDDSDDDEEVKVSAKSEKTITEREILNSGEGVKETPEGKTIENVPLQEDQDEPQQPIQVVDGIWENFKTYKANLEKRESKQMETEEMLNKKMETDEQTCSRLSEEVISIINMDHDYCGPPAGTVIGPTVEDIPENAMQLEETPAQDTLLPLSDAEKTEETKEKTDDDLKACDADHNYCYTNTSATVDEEKEKEPTSEHPTSTVSPSKKKQKSPKKKQKRSASSSSSDSSSSDSSTCSCGTNCSCSSSSSSSSGSSSSQSSDSDSSSSEGRRRQAARRERRRERARKRKAEETEETVQQAPPPQSPKAEPVETAANGPPGQEEVAPVPNLVEPEDVELPIRESDLDTDETETDEDFYDKYPQRLANKLLAEKRNQLLLLAAVAPVNNGTMSQSCQSPPPSSIEEPVPKKKLKTKKHKKSQHQHLMTENKAENKIKLNIPTDYYSSQTPVYSKATVPSSSTSNSINTASVTTPTRIIQSPFLTSAEPSTPTASYQSTGSGSETESKRLSKRKRVPKRFYGDSSDEETDQPQPPVKWRKVSTASSNSPAPTPPTAPAFTYKSTPITVSEPFHNPSPPVPANEEKSEEEAAEDSDSDHEDAKKTSSESSNSESEGEKEPDDDVSDADSETEAPSLVQANPVSAAREGGTTVQQKNENLYCYCQCPYDEVSEMIACDGKDCTIEWFHFECVGIMVPPKGKWFCPDCRKRAATRSEYLLHV